jgi:hypothetical protein
LLASPRTRLPSKASTRLTESLKKSCASSSSSYPLGGAIFSSIRGDTMSPSGRCSAA